MNPHQARPLLGFRSRYTCEQHLALRAWSSGKLRKAPLAEQVETLRHYPGLEPAFVRQATEALAAKCPVHLQRALATLRQQTDYRHQHRRQVRQHSPLIADHILP